MNQQKVNTLKTSTFFRDTAIIAELNVVRMRELGHFIGKIPAVNLKLVEWKHILVPYKLCK